MKRHADTVLHSLVLIRLGQELGTDSELARGVARAVDFVIHAMQRFLC